MFPPTHPVHQLAHHAIPHLGVSVSGSVLSVLHQLQLVGEAHMFGDFRGQLGAVTFVPVVSFKLLVVLLQHHVGSFLQAQRSRVAALSAHTQTEAEAFPGLTSMVVIM